MECVVATMVLGIALMGLFPLMVMQSRVIESLELRYTDNGNQTNVDHQRNWSCPVFRNDIKAAGTIPRDNYGDWYLWPCYDQWACRLGASAMLSKQPPPDKPAPPVLVADDADPDDPYYTEDTPANWSANTSVGFLTDCRLYNVTGGTTPDYVAWTFTDVVPGRYKVEATWPVDPDPMRTQTTDAQYVLHDGNDAGTTLPTVSQQIAPSGYVDSTGTTWQVLTSTPCYIKSGTATVKLNGQSATGYVAADGVRLVAVDNDVQVDALERKCNTEEVTAVLSVTEH